jgi:hypothetical protein
MNRTFVIILLFSILCSCLSKQQQTIQEEGRILEEAFLNPPESSKVWVLWDWINCNVSREGITKDLESMRELGINGVIWRGLAGPWWAPGGVVKPYSPEWHDFMQWAIEEAERLDINFTVSIDFGYGSGGPHITPEISMQKLYWNKIIVDGGKKIEITINRPEISREIDETNIFNNIRGAWIRQEEHLSDKVLNDINKIDSYSDIAVLAIQYSKELQAYQIPQYDLRAGLGENTYFVNLDKLSPPENAVIAGKRIIDLTSQMNSEGKLFWEAPPGQWQIIRLGHASSFKLTRPGPSKAVGLECDRLNPQGIKTHFDAFLYPILKNAGSKTGNTLTHIFLDSWEAGGQNWTKELPKEFRKRRGYDITPWLPVLTGIVIDSPELTERFLWDFRQTISEMTLDNYHRNLKELISTYNVDFSLEAYGNLSINTLKYAELSDFPIGEFWTLGRDHYPFFGNQKYYNTMKTMASASHTKGIKWVGAEAFTGFRGWKDHPFIFKGIGDEAFCRGINKFILHLSAHQAYDQMVPGLTHRRWGGHFNRHNTWWKYSKPWFDYLNRCQFMLQQGQFIADVIYFFGEGAPLNVKDMDVNLPQGYDYDLCSSDIVQQMKVQDGRIVLPSGMSYRYLLLPDTDKLTLSSAEKINELINSGAHVIVQKRITGAPGLSGYPVTDKKVKQIFDQLWNVDKLINEKNWEILFQQDNLNPDFMGEGLNYIHRKTDNVDVYFVSNPEPAVVKVNCSFRISDKIPELWNPETGEIMELSEYSISGERVSVLLEFEPMQSWFVVFRKSKPAGKLKGKNFPEYLPIKNIKGSWEVSFDSKWGGPEKSVAFDSLADWSRHNDQRICFYSGSATYSKSFNLSSSQLPQSTPVFLDLGKVEVIARVKVNGQNCGIAWKPPYRVNITQAVQEGENRLEIEVVNTWVNRMIGDEQLPEDCEWIDWETLKEWPEWFLNNKPRPSGRYTFTTAKHYKKDDPLVSSGLLGPVTIYKLAN